MGCQDQTEHLNPAMGRQATGTQDQCRPNARTGVVSGVGYYSELKQMLKQTTLLKKKKI